MWHRATLKKCIRHAVFGWVAAALLLGAFASWAPLEAGPYPKLFGT
jgi:hypothetical protein